MTTRHAERPSPPLLEALPALVEANCRRLGISQRTAAADLGLSPSAVTRVVQGKGCDAYALLQLLPWLGLTSDWLEHADEARNAYWRGWGDAEARIRAALDAEPTTAAPGRVPCPHPKKEAVRRAGVHVFDHCRECGEKLEIPSVGQRADAGWRVVTGQDDALAAEIRTYKAEHPDARSRVQAYINRFRQGFGDHDLIDRKYPSGELLLISDLQELIAAAGAES